MGAAGVARMTKARPVAYATATARFDVRNVPELVLLTIKHIMTGEIVALQCPKCGSTLNVNRKEMRFGLEFSCSHCGTASILIIDNHLHVCRADDRVCAKCGRLASSSAKYCQCGAILINTCQVCRAEFAVVHRICDFCGWPHGLDPESAEGLTLRVQRALRNAESRQPNWNSFIDEVLAARAHLGNDGSRVTELLLDLVRSSIEESGYDLKATFAIKQLGADAVRAIPNLAKIALSKWESEPHISSRCLEAIQSIASERSDARQRDDFESIARRLANFLEGRDPISVTDAGHQIVFASTCGAIAALGLVDSACAIAVRECRKGIVGGCLGFKSLEAIGTPAVPTLTRFTKGLFRDRWLDQCARSSLFLIEKKIEVGEIETVRTKGAPGT
jgi:predicted RNA-binding Zn-ribbon protein involved in translation (DUF1610 family)